MIRVWDACASHYLDIRIWMENKKKRELLAYRNLFHFYGFCFVLPSLYVQEEVEEEAFNK